MQLDNRTPYAARILRLERSEEEIQSTVVVKSTFERDPSGKLVPAAEQVPIVDDRLDTPFGIFHTDCFVRKENTDICVLGTVHLDFPVKTARVTLDVDDYATTLSLFGDRRWTRGGAKLAPTEPLPFREMPLSYSHAYGGVTEHDYEKVTWADNPLGRGHYLSEERAVDQLLPNIEAGDGPMVKEWSDQPPVAGWAPYPLFWGIRAREGIVPRDDKDIPFLVRPRLNNHAHPALIVPSISTKSVIRIRGMRPRELIFEIPRVSPIVEVQLGKQTHEVATNVDGVFIWADSSRITVTHRAHFNYLLNKGERRQAKLKDAALEKGSF